MTDSTFRAGGLASGIDTNSIVDKLVALESRPLSLLRQRQSGVRAQISALGDLVSRLRALDTAVRGLATDGVAAAKVTSTHAAFAAAPGAGALEGRHDVEVLSLARAARWRSAAFASATAPVAGGELVLTVQGKTLPPIEVRDGTSLSDLAHAIRMTGAPVNATVITAADGAYLSVTARDTGFPEGTPPDPSSALRLEFTRAADATGADPGLAELEAARNASFRIDGLDFTRRTNTVADAIPGVTLTLQKAGPAEELVVGVDADGTRARLQKLVDAYNDVMRLVQRHLAPTKATDRGATLSGDASVRALQARLQQVLVAKVDGLPAIQTLADAGVKTARDGSLSLDATTFSAALSRDPQALAALFSTRGTGIADVVSALVESQTRAGDGLLVSRQSSLDRSIAQMDQEAEAIQRRVEAFRAKLVRQFAAMETTVSGLNAVGNFLAQQAQAQAKRS